VAPWEHNANAYKRRNEIERLFRRIEHCRRALTHSDGTDLVIPAFITGARLAELLR